MFDSTAYRVGGRRARRVVEATAGPRGLAKPAQFLGHQGDAAAPSARAAGAPRPAPRHPHRQDACRSAQTDPAGVCDLVIESAVSTILDLEDSVAVVDADDKVQAYGNWLGILKGTLTENVSKGGKTFVRSLNPDRVYTRADRRRGAAARPLAAVRAQRRPPDDQPGGAATATARRSPKASSTRWSPRRSRCTTCRAHGRSRRHPQQPQRLDLHRQAQDARPGRGGVRRPSCSHASSSCSACADSTVKLGIMDEERRTSVNLKACIAAAASRVAFINTGFLDRTGDEMHTAMQAGPMIRKGDMKASAWIAAYERSNVLVGLQCGLRGKAQIGKGMWAMPDLMARDARAEDRAPAGRRQHRVGAAARPRPRCTRCTTTRSTWPRCMKELEKIDARRRARRAARRPAARAGGGQARLERGRAASRRSTTTRRASSATWCAGSTRAWAAPRCPTSTTSA